jgi:hypothetical protein
MQPLSRMSRAARLLAMTLLLTLASRAVAVDVFSQGILQIPSVTIGNATFSNMVVSITGVTSGPAGMGPLTIGDSYDPTTNLLSVAAVQVGANTYYNVIATVIRSRVSMSTASSVGCDVTPTKFHA